MNLFKRGVAVLAATGAVSLTGCALPGQDHASNRAAEGKIERLVVVGSEPTGKNWWVVPGTKTYGPVAKQYRWVVVQGIPDNSLTTIGISTSARVPDGIGRLHDGDLVDVYFKGVARADFDKLDTAVVLRLVCPHEFPIKHCWKDLAEKEGKSYILGPTGESVPDLTQPQYASTPYFDQDGHPLPGKTIPDKR